MSNLTQFIGGGGGSYPLYAQINMVNQNTSLVELTDGTKWYYNIPTAPFPYTSEYSYLPDIWVTPHALFPGPESDGTWVPRESLMSIAYDPSSGIYITSSYFGIDTTNGYSYYRSTNHGQTWTLHQYPFTSFYNMVCFTGGKFFAWAQSTTTNAILSSTDGINWTAANSPASINPVEVISGGGNLFAQATSSTGAYSGDGGATWTSVTGLPSQSWNAMPGQGRVTYNAGAGLFILAQTASGSYATSPTGQTWTNRNTQPTFAPYAARFFGGNTGFASSPTTTIAVGNGGFFATTTDGLTWSNHNFIPGYPKTSGPNQVYYDGTRFVVRYNYWIWYSTNGINWTQGKPIGGCTLITPQSNGVLFAFPLYTNGIKTLGFRIADVTATNRNYVICPVLHVTEFTNGIHYRIK